MIITQEIKTITETIRKAVPAEKIYLFGSYAYGEPNENSDYDFYIVVPDGSMRPIEVMQEAAVAVYPLNLGKPIDVMANYRSRFDELKQLITLERTVDRKGVLVYG